MTLGNLFDKLEGYDITCKIHEGIITLESELGKYITGNGAEELGIHVMQRIGTGIVTGGGEGGGTSTVVGGSTVSTATLAQFGIFLGSTTTINIKSSDGAVIASQEFYNSAKISDLITFFTKYGISAKIENNILVLDNDNGIYAEDASTGGLLTQIGVGITTKSVATSFLTIITSSSAESAIAISKVDTLTAGNVYSINSLSDLNKLATMVNSGQSSNCTFILTQDIDMNNFPGFVPIGNSTNQFNGTFYGNGHIISNISISQAGTSGVGIFGYTGSASRILDLGIENAKVTGGAYTAVLVGNSAGTISNCYVKGNIQLNGEHSVGAIAGQSSNTIINSYTSGTINAQARNGNVGGLVGYATGFITNAFAEGNITLSNTLNGGNVGGFAGFVNSKLTNCSLFGTVNASTTASNGQYVGGFIGDVQNFASFSNCSMEAAVNISSNYYVGGAFGRITTGTGTNLNNFRAKITSGTVTATNITYLNEKNNRCAVAGGIAGYISGNSGDTLSNCIVNNLTINAKGSSVGGIAGSSDVNISNCSATANIKVNMDTPAYNIKNGYNVGGIAGKGVNISQCSANTTINIEGVSHNTNADGDLNYTHIVSATGGIAGEASVVQSCTATTKITVNNADTVQAIGGVAGKAYSVSNCYSNINFTSSGNFYTITGIGGTAGSISDSQTVSGCSSDVNFNFGGNIKIELSNIAGIVTNLNYYTPNLSNNSSNTTINITGTSNNNFNFGGIISSADNSSIDKCSSNFKLNAQNTTVLNVGGIVGSIYSSNTTGTIISNSTSTVNIAVKGGNKIGGIAGINNASSNQVYNCTANATITTTTNSSSYIGGIVGSGGNINQCSANVNFNIGTGNSDNSYVGGLAGANQTILNSHTSGTIKSTSTRAKDIGGAAGSANGASNSYSSVELNFANVNSDSRNQYFGGFAGEARSPVQSCYATGNVNAGQATYVGGFAGYANNVITKSYSTGNVTGSKYVGGFVGEFRYGTIQNCYTSGNVTGSGSSINIGGFSGNTGGRIDQSYASGIASSGVGFTSNGYACYNCYYNNANTATSNGTGITLAQMQNQTTMTGYGFTAANGWTYQAGKTPLLNFTAGKTSNTAAINVNKPNLTFNVNKNVYNFFSVLRPVNTNSNDLQNILDTEISFGNNDGGIAVETDLLGNVVSFPETYLTIHIKSSDGAIITSKAFNQFARISEMLDFFNKNGIEATMKNGIIYLDNKGSGIWADDAIAGGILAQMNITKINKQVPTSFLTIITSSSAESAIAISKVDTLTAGNVYSINSLSDLNKLATMVNSGQSSNCTFILTQDIDMNNFPGFVPIGNSTNQFNGTFYGNGHIISNISISQAGTSGVGIFGYTGSASRILDLGIENAKVTGGAYTAVLVGNSAGTISNCYVKGNIQLNGEHSVGAIAGQSSNTIINSYTSGTINAQARNGNVGGLVGYATGFITNAFAEGNITLSNTLNGGNVGGFAGFVNSKLTNCSLFGTVNASTTASNGQYVGGFIGDVQNFASFSNCSMEAAVNISSNYYVGGAFGRITTGTGTNLNNFRAKITSGTVTATNITYLNEKNNRCAVAGGIAGYISGNSGDTLSNCIVNNLTINAKGSSVGGIAGSSDVNISNCSATANIKVNMDTPAYNIKNGYNVGGIAGKGVNISQCSANTTINIEGVSHNTNADGDLNYTHIVSATGGIAGEASVVQSCTATTKITVNNADTVQAIGGVAGKAYSVSNCYSNINFTSSGNFYTITGIGGTAGSISDSQTVSGCSSDVNFNFGGNIKIELSNIAGIVTNLNYYTPNLSNNSSNTTINITGTSNNNFNFGGIISSADNSSIDKCSSNFKLNAQNTTVLNVGGIVGSIYSSNTTGTIISNSTSTVNIAVKGGNKIGGIAGINNASSNQVYNCTANATITTTTNSSSYIGGIVGSGGNINQCSANVNFNIGTGNSDNSYVGGLAGANQTILNSHTSGTIKSTSTRAKDIGGAAGSANGASNSYSSVELNFANVNSDSRNQYFGGFAGEARSPVQSCYATGNVNAGQATYVGGFAGYANNVITKSYSTGNVTGSKYVGGFVGEFRYGTIQNCYTSGNVTGSGSSINIGGFSGNTGGRIDQSYASGIASSGVGFTSNGYACYNCYYNNANTATSNGTGITLAQMQNQTTMTGYGFTAANGWTYQAGKTPLLNFTAGKTSNTAAINVNKPNLTFNVNKNVYNFFEITRPANSDSDTLHRVYEATITGPGGGGMVTITIMFNSTSDLLIYDKTTSLTTGTTFAQLGLTTNGLVTIVSDKTQYIVTIQSSDTIDDFLTTVAGMGISGAVHDGKMSLTGTGSDYITGMTKAYADALKLKVGKDQTYRETTVKEIVHTPSGSISTDKTNTMNSDTTLGDLGITGNQTITINSGGTNHVVTVKPDQTLGDLLATLAGLGISGSINGGKLELNGSDGSFIAGISGGLAGVLGIGSGANTSYTVITSATKYNTDSKNLEYVTNNIALTEDTKLSAINGFANGNGNLAIHQTNGKFVTISVNASSTLSEFFTQISQYGLVGSIDSSGKVAIEGIGNVYMQAVSGGSNVLTALKLSNVINNVQTVTVNRTSNVLSHTIKVAASGATQIQNLATVDGTTMGSGNGTIILSTTSNAGNQLVTLTFARTSSIYDVINKLAEYGIQSSIDASGKFSVSSSTLTDFSISGNLGNLLMGAYNKVYGKGDTRNMSTNLIQTTTGPMTRATALSTFGITGGNILITQQGVNYTVNIDTTKVKTVGDFLNLLSQYGFNSDIDAAGRISISGIGESKLSTIAGGSNILDKFGLTNWTLGEITQTSDHLGDYQTIVEKPTLETKLNELTNTSGTSLGISSGNIYVYKDGTRHLVNINNDDTLQTLSAKLSQYGITMTLASDGKIYFDGDNNSYMTTQGLSSGSSNILQKLGVDGNWSTRYDSTSNNLKYNVDTNNRISGDTKLSELQDSAGNNLGITEGAFYVYNKGVRTTETITADMTVNDLMATLARNGLVADISEDGSISIGAHHNSYLATSAIAGANSNIVSTLFSEWNFVNIYTSNNLQIPEDKIVAVDRDTKLKDINEGTYKSGIITVVKDGIQTNITLTDEDTIGTLMDTLSLYGFESVINEKGQLILKNTGNSLLQNYSGTDASNALELLGIDLNNWIQTNTYEGKPLDVIKTSTIDAAATRDTELSLLGVTTGEYFIYNNGVKYTAYVSTGETLGSFLDTLKSFGIETSLVTNGDKSVLTIIGSGDSYITKSTSTTDSSNVVEKLFGNTNHYSSYKYTGLEQTSEIVTTFSSATEETLLSYFNKPWGSDTLKAEGTLSVNVNGENAKIEITADETFGSLLDKFKALGLEATLSSDGQIMIQSGYNTFTINTDGTTSSLLATIGLTYKQDLGGFAASSDTTKATTTLIEEKTFSVANHAAMDTKLGLLNISDGTLSVYKNGQKATLQVKKDETFGDLRARLAAAFADVDIDFEGGYLKFFSKTEGDSIEVGATTDTSNISAICGLTNDGNGAVKSARELFCVNSDSIITKSGLFRKGDVTEGSFIIGNATFSIASNTSMANLIAQINSSDEANATAYWDSIDGKLVIKSRTTGSALINIEAGTSNFTDIMGFTSTERNANGSVDTTKMNISAQYIGNNAKFSINGTSYTSNSNNITSDISRIKGLTINLKGLTEGSAVTLTVERDKETLANAVSEVVDSYNELMKNVDEAIAKDGKLHNQSVLKILRNQIRNLMTSSDAGTTVFRNLDSIGICVEAAKANNISTAGITTLMFDKDKFIKAFEADEDALKALLIGSKSNTGVLTKIEDLVESALKSVTGYFDSADNSYQKQVNKIENKIERQKKALDRYRAQLEAKFSSMDILIANMQQQYASFLRT